MRFRLVALLFALSACPAAAQTIDGPPIPEPPAVIARDAQGRVTVRAMRLPSPIVFDGRLDENVYSLVPPLDGFVQQEPVEGAQATDRTEAWVFFDGENLYVSARLHESDPSRRVTTEIRRDSSTNYNNDHFAVIFDTFYDRRNAFGFSANSKGGIFDWEVRNEQPSNDWNALFEVKTADFDGGWTIEFVIPFRSLRFKEGSTVWGINFRRMVRWKNELTFLNPVPRSWGRRGLSKVSSTGTLGALETPRRQMAIDVKPYVLGSLATNRAASPPISNDGNAEVGVDVKWGITQSIIADFTYNTDFAQVEDDEAQVNLTRFSLFFQEKRDFFLEGQEIFAFGSVQARGNNNSQGSQNVGAGGGGGVNAQPNVTPVMFYSRRIGLSGGAVIPILGGARVLGRAGAWQMGALSIQTDDVNASGVESTNFSVLRVNRDLFRRSRVGFLTTRRDPATGGGTGETFGADAQFGIGSDLTLLGYVAATRAADTSADDEISYRARVDYGADRYGVQAEHLYVGEGFNPEVGFLRRSAFRRSYALGRFSPRPAAQRSAIRKWYFEGSYEHITKPSGDLESREALGAVRMDLSSGDQWFVEVTRSFEAIDRRFEVARGLFVPIGDYEFNQVRATYSLGPQRRVNGQLTFGRGGFYGGTLTELTWRGRVDVAPQFFVEPTLSWNRSDLPWGVEDTNLVSTRVTYSLTPRMFASALVQYQSRTASVSTNARFRWEYQPGSELFVVYSDGRTTLTRGFPDMENRSLVVKVTKLLRW